MRGGMQGDAVAAIPPLAPFRSSLHVPLVTEGRVAGLTYLASLHAGAFAEGDEQVLVELTTHASGAYRRLESSVTRLRVTPRQSQILALVSAGLADKEIAARLNMAHRTVRTHLDRLMHEHGLHSRAEAVTAWLRGQQQ
jgi:DNA-binding NarL/FixJ family response regulator